MSDFLGIFSGDNESRDNDSWEKLVMDAFAESFFLTPDEITTAFKEATAPIE